MKIRVETESDYSNYLNLIEKGEEIEILRWNIRRNIPFLPNSLTELKCYNNPLLYFPYDIPKFGIQRNVNKIPTLRKVIKKFRDKVRIKRENELLFLPLPISLIKMICEY